MTDFPPDDLKNRWQNQHYEGNPISLEEIRRKVQSYRKRTILVNLVDYLALSYVLFRFVWAFYRERNTGLLVNIAFALLVAGALYILHQRRKMGSAEPLPAEMGSASCAEAYRRALERRRDLVRSIWRWGIAPLVPGLAVLEIAAACLNLGHRTPVNLALTMLGYNAIIAAGFFAGWKYNQWAARRLQQQIDQLDALVK